MQECEDNKTWIEEYIKNNKPKKKLDKKKLNKDIWENVGKLRTGMALKQQAFTVDG